MSKQFKLLLLGCGDIATRLAGKLCPERYDITGLRRTPVPVGAFPVLTGDACSAHDIDALMLVGFDAIVVTMTPSERNEAGYHRSYYQTMDILLRAIELSDTQPLVLFVSSTSVYGQNSGEWIDEESITEPVGFAGNTLLAAEKRLQSSGVAHSIVRFSGIYGPGRTSQLKAVLNNKPLTRPLGWTNRIHSDDCAGVLAHLLERHYAGGKLEPLYIASDNQPIMQWQLRAGLCEMLGREYVSDSKTMDGCESGKRCCNKQLLASGYQFVHADYVSGYCQLVDLHKAGE